MSQVHVLRHRYTMGILGKTHANRQTIFAFKSNMDALSVRRLIVSDYVSDVVWQEGMCKYRIKAPLNPSTNRYCPLVIETHGLEELAKQISLRSSFLKVFVADTVEKLENQDIVLKGYSFTYHRDFVPSHECQSLLMRDLKLSHQDL